MITMFGHATLLLIACYILYQKGNPRNYWAAVCLSAQYTALLGVFFAVPDAFTAFALVYSLAAIGFLNFSQTDVGRWLGILSVIQGVLCIVAAWGWIGTELNQGMWAVNVYNWTGWLEATQTVIIMMVAMKHDTVEHY
ncbi:MAG: hypothetical protein GY749_22675 [Desulfobacteraceae bacterium]|nr:hypothetical protein [Desulfobacteraceae bacterium]